MSNEKVKTNWSLVLFLVAIALILINFTSLWLTTRELSVGTENLYWQKFNNYLSGAWYFSCLLVPIVLGAWAKIGINKFRYAVVWFSLSVILLFAYVAVDYFSIFALKFVDHIGTIGFNGNIYQFAQVTNYDRGTTYYLGKCDDSEYKCVFHAVYNKSDEGYYIPTSIEITQDSIQLMRNGEIVYGFDGVVEKCFTVERYYGDCLIKTP